MTPTPRIVPITVGLLCFVAPLTTCGAENLGDEATPTSNTTALEGSTPTSNTTALERSTSTSNTSALEGSTSTVGAESENTDIALAVVDRYIAAIADGDLTTAWDLVDERSRDSIGSFDDFVSLESALTEGIGAWSDADDRQEFVSSVGVIDGAEVRPVTLLGFVVQEGPPTLAATSILTRIGPDGATVSPFENPFGDLGFPAFDPVDGSEVTADDVVIVSVPVGLEPILIAIDGVPADFEPLKQANSDGDAIAHVLAGLGVEPGPHALTVVIAANDGAMTSIALAYTVTESS